MIGQIAQLFGFKQVQQALDVKDFIFTNKTVSYGGRTIQLCAITRIWIYNLVPKNIIKFIFSSGNVILGVIITLFTALVHDNDGDIVVALLSIIIIGIIGFYKYVRQFTNKARFGIVIETASGSENLVSKNQEFSEHLFVEISKIMNQEESKSIIANFQTGSIKYVDNSTITLGDVFNNIKDSNINNRSNV